MPRPNTATLIATLNTIPYFKHLTPDLLARLLLTSAAGDVVPRQRWTTQAELAARLGIVPDVLSRALPCSCWPTSS